MMDEEPIALRSAERSSGGASSGQIGSSNALRSKDSEFAIDGGVPVGATPTSGDDFALARMGKAQVLTRRFGLVSMTGFSCGLMCTWEGMLVVFLLGYENGGPAGLIYGFFLTWAGTLSTFIVMGELASMVPTAGGQYHWVSILAPNSYKRFLSYVTGWITVAGWVAAAAATAFFVSSLIQGMIVLNNPNYDPVGWQGTLLYWAVLAACVFINTTLSRALPALEIVILLLHVLGFFVILIPLVYLAPKGDTQTIWTSFQNGGNWQTQALSFFIGLNGNAVAFVGGDGAIHMSEEVHHASKNVPRSMILSILINGFLSLGMLLAVLYCMGDITEAINAAPNGYPFMLILSNGLGSVSGATAMSCLIAILELCSCAAGLAAASRMLWSFARDRGLPAHRFLGKVDPRTTIPTVAVLVVFVWAMLLGLINIGSSTAFNAVVSLVLEGFYTSYLLACGMLLYRRCTGAMREPDGRGNMDGSYEWGPWRVRGMLGVANNIAACAYLLLLAFFSYWPTQNPVTAANMNYSSLVLGIVAIFSMVYYFIWARRTYSGPIVEVQVDKF